jgi:predicted DCC family thiol-disulfide oxidoreductase YuxK
MTASAVSVAALCSFCSATICIAFSVLLRSATGRAVVEDFGGDPTQLTSFYVLANYRTRHTQIFAKSQAALFVAGQLGWPWKAAVIARILPSALLDRAYDVVARNRYRVFGRFEQCLAPRPEFRDRFVE